MKSHRYNKLIWNFSFWKNHLFLPDLYLSSNLVRTMFLAFFFFIGSLSSSLLMLVLSVVPSSEGFTMTAFLPAYLPPRSRITLPAFIIFPILGSLVEVNQAIFA